MLLCVLALGGCSRFHKKEESKYVYVTAKTTYLRDRVAAVSNRTATVQNGQKLKILESRPRFYRVQTEKGETGWIEERAVATGAIVASFEELKEQHANDPVIATGSVRDEVNLHDKPGRDEARFYRLEEGDKLSLLQRASKPKPVTQAPAPKKDDESANEPPPPPPMEDWWLVRTQDGRMGWMLSRMLDVDVPDSIARYAEGQRIVSAYVLTKVQDPEIEGASKDVPIYVTAMSPYVAGLPYDFDQLRVFTWNLKKHRYETAQRDRNIAGYLPIKITTDPGDAKSGPAPAYSYQVLAAGATLPTADADGRFKPSQTITKTYRLEGNVTRRVLKPGEKAPEEYALVKKEEKKDKKAAKPKKR